MRRKAQTEGCIAGWRRKYPVKSGKTLPRVRRGRCLASSRKPCDAANPKRRAKSPALQGTRKRAAMRKRQLSARPADGPMQASAPTQRGDTPQLSSTCRACRPRLCRPYALHCRAGVHARRGGSRRPGGVLVRPCAAPLSRLAPPAPLPGEPFKRQALYKAPPCKGLRSRAPPAAEKARRSRYSGRRAQACFSARRAMRAPQTGRWLRRKAQTEGCIAALPYRYPANSGRALPCIRRGRCLHRPGSPAMPQGSAAGEIARPTLRPGVGGNA